MQYVNIELQYATAEINSFHTEKKTFSPRWDGQLSCVWKVNNWKHEDILKIWKHDTLLYWRYYLYGDWYLFRFLQRGSCRCSVMAAKWILRNINRDICLYYQVVKIYKNSGLYLFFQIVSHQHLVKNIYSFVRIFDCCLVSQLNEKIKHNINHSNNKRIWTITIN